jgi:acyl-CoA hydrolase
MSKWDDMYKQKLCSADDCVKLVKDGDAVVVPLSNGQPITIANALGKRIREDSLKDILFVCAVDVRWLDVFSPDIQDRVLIDTGFVSAATRYGVQQGLYSYGPNRLGHSKDMIEKRLPGLIRGLAACVVSPMDEHGFFSTGCNTDYIWGAIRTGQFRHVAVEVNPNMPRTFGNNHLHISEVDVVVEDNTPLVELPEIPIIKEDEIIGRYIADMIEDGSCLQIGIGGMPNIDSQLFKRQERPGYSFGNAYRFHGRPL